MNMSDLAGDLDTGGEVMKNEVSCPASARKVLK